MDMFWNHTILISVVSIYADEEVFLVKFLGNFVLSCIESEQIFLERVNLAHDD